MSYTFTATGLPPGLSLVGSQILGTPSAAGNYTATLTVSDGVSSVSETVSITIAPAAVPVPFWQLILDADCGSYSLDSARAQLQTIVEAGSHSLDSAEIAPAPSTVTATDGSYWLDSAVAAIAESGSYSLDSAGARLEALAESGSYSLDSAGVLTEALAEAGSYSLDSTAISLQTETLSWISRVQGLGGQPTSAAPSAIDAFFVAIKPQSYYSKLKLMQLLAGATTIESAMAPLKHPSNTVASQAGFSSSDYTSSGSGAGIQGNGSGYVDHNFSLYDNLPGSSAAIGTYSKTDGGYDVYDCGLVISSTETFEISMKWSNLNFYADCFSAIDGRVSASSPGGIGLSTLSRTSATDVRYFLDGTQYGINTAANAAMPISMGSFFSFAGRAAFGVSPRKLTFTFASVGMTPTEVAHFSTQVSNLIGSI